MLPSPLSTLSEQVLELELALAGSAAAVPAAGVAAGGAETTAAAEMENIKAETMPNVVE